MVALLVIQAVQIVQLYERKTNQFNKKVSNTLETIALQHEKAEDVRRYLQIADQDISGQYKDILKEEFQNLLRLQESISIKDTSIIEADGVHDYLLIQGSSYDSLSGLSTEHRVMARDLRQLRELFDKQSGRLTPKDSSAIAIQLDQKVLQHIFRKAKFVNEMMVDLFRNNVYAKPSDRIDLNFLDSVIHHEVQQEELPSDYTFLVEDEKGKPVEFDYVTENYNIQQKGDGRFGKTSLFPSNVLDDQLTLHVVFPNRNAFLFKDMLSALIFNLLLAFVVLSTLVFLFRTIRAQNRLSELKNDFISNMTHEFKTPISTISLACEAMSDSSMMGEVTDKTRPYVKMINEENNRLGLLVESILQSNVIDKGQLRIRKEPLILNELIFDVCQHAKMRIDSQGGELHTDIGQTLMETEADKMHLSNCLHNLIDNAIKYSNGVPKVSVSLIDKGNQYQIEVADKGVGIKKEHLGKIFDSLYRVPTGNVHNVKGFGLGLSYVKSIVDIHSWEIDVKSEFGVGSTFTLTITNEK